VVNPPVQKIIVEESLRRARIAVPRLIDSSDLLNLCQEVLAKGSTFRFRALGGSMFPLIRPGDIITAKPIPVENLTVGQVLFYCKNGKLFVHRLKEKSRDRLMVTRGDNLPFNDHFITPSEVLGKIVMIERKGKKIDMESGFMRWVNWTVARIPIYWIIRSMLFGTRIKRALQWTFR
jgi:signal peptidase I